MGCTSTIRVALACDQDYLGRAAVTLCSVVLSADPSDVIQAHLMVEEGGQAVARVHVRALEEIALSRGIAFTCEVVTYSSELFEGLPTGFDPGAASIFSTAVYARLLLPRVVPATWRELLYLDCDILVRGSLSPLFLIDLGILPLAACVERYAPTVSAPQGIASWRELGLSPDLPYFNSGVQLMNLSVWREEFIGERAIEYAREMFGQLLHLDQEALNAVVAGRFARLDDIWNATSYWRKRERRATAAMDILDVAIIRHFTGPYKPWERAGLSVPHAEEYRYVESVLRLALGSAT
ncbi:glycosyltransferase family 8 protein [Luteococcus sp. OSA5]|uniref:glycosyltransferase family 8 protein n=1 Tax=Luteococcus sp. OSA5 TaxID=3401630 RepID=UPI003B42E76C